MLEGLKEDPNGPQIDLRAELIEHLGRRISMLTDYQLPITTTSERLLFAIEAKNPKAVALAHRETDEERSHGKRRGELATGHVIWEDRLGDAKTTGRRDEAAQNRSFGDEPAVAPAASAAEEKEGKEEGDEEEEERSELPCCPTRR